MCRYSSAAADAFEGGLVIGCWGSCECGVQASSRTSRGPGETYECNQIQFHPNFNYKINCQIYICPIQVLVGEQRSILSLIQSVSWSLMWLLLQTVEETLYQVSAKTHGLRPVMITDNPINATNSRGFIWTLIGHDNSLFLVSHHFVTLVPQFHADLQWPSFFTLTHSSKPKNVLCTICSTLCFSLRKWRHSYFG